jgi:hypothetical protein
MKTSILLLSVAMALAICGCRNSNIWAGSNAGSTETVVASETPPMNPRDYFPTGVGTTWTYRIMLRDTDALYAREETWRLSEQYCTSATIRGRYFSRDNKSSYLLTLKVKAAVRNQGTLRYPEGVELAVVKDELGIYYEVKQVFWAIADPDRFEVTEVRMYDQYSSGAPTDYWNTPLRTGDGSSKRMLFSGAEPGVGISFAGETFDRLVALGSDPAGLSFQRFIKEKKRDESEGNGSDALHQAYTEVTRYKKGVGLNYLEQKVGGKTTMTWTLEKFTPAK